MRHVFIPFLLLLSASLSLYAQADDRDIDSVAALDEVVVTGSREAVDIRYLPMTVTSIVRGELTRSNSPNILPVVMQRVPGLMLTSRGMYGYGVSTGSSGNLSLRGVSGGAGQMLVLIDGNPQYNGIYGHPISDSYLTLMTERVEVLRGPASAIYGSNAMGGVVNIVTRDMRADGVAGGLNIGAGSYGTVQSDFDIQARKGGFFTTLSGQFARTDNHRPDMGFMQAGGYLKVGYDFSRHWRVYADINLTDFSASNPGTITNPKRENDQSILRGNASVVVRNSYARTNGALSLYDNFGRHTINDGYELNGGTPQTDLFRSRDAVRGVSFYQTLRLLPGNHVTLGIDYQNIYGHAYYTDRKTGEVVTTPKRLKQSADADENDLAGYVDLHQDIASWLTACAALRYDHHSVAGGEWVPQAGLVWRPLATAQLKATASKGFRNPTTRELYMYGTANHDSLRAEKVMSYELAWRHTPAGDRLTYGVNVYYIKGDNMIQVVAGKNVNTGEIENCGAECELSYAVSPSLTFTTNHAVLHMEHKVVAAPEYKGYVDAVWTCGSFSITPSVLYLHNLYTSVGETESRQSPLLVNLSASYSFSSAISVWLRLDNILDQDYEINLGYPMPGITFMAGARFTL